MGPPTLWHRFRQVIGRAFRETGQALDRLGVQTAAVPSTLRKDTTTTNNYLDYNPTYIYQDPLSRHRNLFPLLTSGGPTISPAVAYIAPCSTLIGSVHVDEGASIWYGAILRADYCQNVESLLINDNKNNNNTLKLEQQQQANQQEEHPLLDNNPDGLIQQQQQPQHDSSDSNDEIDNNLDIIDDRIWKLDEKRFIAGSSSHKNDMGGGIFIGSNTNVQDNVIITSRVNHCILGVGVTVGHSAQIHSARIGNYTLVGMGCLILPNVVVGQESLIGAGSVIPRGTVIGDGELWVGNPARKVRDLTMEQRAKLQYQSSEYKILATGQQHLMQLGGNEIFSNNNNSSMLSEDDVIIESNDTHVENDNNEKEMSEITEEPFNTVKISSSEEDQGSKSIDNDVIKKDNQ